jgi:hypothetical protein
MGQSTYSSSHHIPAHIGLEPGPQMLSNQLLCRHLDLFWVKRNVQKYANLSRVDFLDSTDDEAEAFSTFKPTGEDSSPYVDYIYRGPKLVHFCLYEYLSQIGISTRRSAPRGSFSFATGHPKFDTHRQYSAKLRRPSSDDDGDIDGLWVPAIYGRLTEVNNRGNSADHILADSQDVQKDIAEALLGLFVPWERLTPLFAEYASDETVFKEPRDACARIWDHIEPSLPVEDLNKMGEQPISLLVADQPFPFTYDGTSLTED